jgi:hypothetical protein
VSGGLGRRDVDVDEVMSGIANRTS